MTGQERKVYFTQGHGEKDTGSAERDGYSGIIARSARDNYKVEKLVLAQQGEVPADATVVVVAGPANRLPRRRKWTRFERYLDKGGKLLADAGSAGRAPTPRRSRTWSPSRTSGASTSGNNVVVDVSGMGRLLGTDASVPVAAQLPAATRSRRSSTC